MKQKLISYLRKLHVDLKLEKDKNESLADHMKLQMKISKNCGLTEESMLPEKYDNMHQDIQPNSNGKRYNSATTIQNKCSEDGQNRNTANKTNEAAGASENLNGIKRKMFQLESTIPENNFNKS